MQQEGKRGKEDEGCKDEVRIDEGGGEPCMAPLITVYVWSTLVATLIINSDHYGKSIITSQESASRCNFIWIFYD